MGVKEGERIIVADAFFTVSCAKTVLTNASEFSNSRILQVL